MNYQISIGNNVFEVDADSPQDALDKALGLEILPRGHHAIHISAGVHKYCADLESDEYGVITNMKWGFVQ
jgi:hypothetical protein